MLTYLHSDHLGSTRLTTDVYGKQDGSMYYRAYGLQRGGDNVATENQFTGQKQDGSGLQYFAARYYDPALGTFISPDTIVPDAGLVSDYNRSMYTRGNPLKYNDPSGHAGACAMTGVPYIDVGCQIGDALYTYGPQLAQWAQQLWPFANQGIAAADQASHSAAQNGGTGGNSANSGDPNDPFRNATKVIRKGVDTLRQQVNNVKNYYQYRLGAKAHLARAEFYNAQGTLQSVNATGKGTIDLVLNNNVGVEVKYWSAQTVMNNARQLADQINGFSSINLNLINVEFVQTVNNPVTQATIDQLTVRLNELGVNLTNVVFTIVSNPGIK